MADSPRLIVYVCRCSDAELHRELADLHPERMYPVEYVPREQSDALAEALEGIRDSFDRGGIYQSDREREQAARDALNSYREATQ